MAVRQASGQAFGVAQRHEAVEEEADSVWMFPSCLKQCSTSVNAVVNSREGSGTARGRRRSGRWGTGAKIELGFLDLGYTFRMGRQV